MYIECVCCVMMINSMLIDLFRHDVWILAVWDMRSGFETKMSRVRKFDYAAPMQQSQVLYDNGVSRAPSIAQTYTASTTMPSMSQYQIREVPPSTSQYAQYQMREAPTSTSQYVIKEAPVHVPQHHAKQEAPSAGEPVYPSNTVFEDSVIP